MDEIAEKVARWWKPTEHKKILCSLCPRYCKIGQGQTGFCYIRKNVNGRLIATGYGHPTGFAIDPIEKKPLSHFLPGTEILSFGTAGCNLGCKFCQNWSMSKAKMDDINALSVSPEGVISLAKKHHVPSIAYTYNDPTIFGEYVVDISQLARAEGIKSVMVTNGYIDKEARRDVYQFIDAANVDLKAFTNRFYRKLTYAHLEYVLDTLRWLKEETDIWIEITTLLIPGENDSSEEITKMCNWILKNIGDTTPLHFTAFHPDFRMKNKPRTPESTLRKARQISLKEGVKYCYIGNVFDHEGQTTFCPKCNTTLIERNWHSILSNRIENEKCYNCGYKIAGIFRRDFKIKSVSP
jgi:pyruvate formate lyase activating enzyme